jgi:pimeloyl-ACP methyl ester carboxylesterase
MRLLDPLFGWEAVEYALAARLGRKRARALVAAACERLRQGHHDLYQELAAEPELAEALPELAPLFDPTHNLGQSEPLVRRALAAHDSTPATRTLQLAHQKIGYELKGSATAPVVVLAHALGANLTLWDAQTVALTPHFRVLRYDLRGHGQTSTPTGAYTLDQLGNDVVALLDSLGVPRVHFCGISLGGLIGLWLGLHAPERLHSLVLANTAARIASEQRTHSPGPPERLGAADRANTRSLAESRHATPLSRSRPRRPRNDRRNPDPGLFGLLRRPARYRSTPADRRHSPADAHHRRPRG